MSKPVDTPLFHCVFKGTLYLSLTQRQLGIHVYLWVYDNVNTFSKKVIRKHVENDLHIKYFLFCIAAGHDLLRTTLLRYSGV